MAVINTSLAVGSWQATQGARVVPVDEACRAVYLFLNVGASMLFIDLDNYHLYIAFT